jgi:hypothetical protein
VVTGRGFRKWNSGFTLDSFVIPMRAHAHFVSFVASRRPRLDRVLSATSNMTIWGAPKGPGHQTTTCARFLFGFLHRLHRKWATHAVRKD